MGMTNKATANDANNEKTTASAKSPKICPATPSTKTIGKKTATVVRVEAKTAPPTSPTPRMVASIRLSPSSRQRAILSRTTIELSTSIPIPRARPPKDMMLRETSNIFMGANVVIIEMGMEIPMMIVAVRLRRKRNKTRTAKIPP